MFLVNAFDERVFQTKAWVFDAANISSVHAEHAEHAEHGECAECVEHAKYAEHGENKFSNLVASTRGQKEAYSVLTHVCLKSSPRMTYE